MQTDVPGVSKREKRFRVYEEAPGFCLTPIRTVKRISPEPKSSLLSVGDLGHFAEEQPWRGRTDDDEFSGTTTPAAPSTRVDFRLYKTRQSSRSVGTGRADKMRYMIDRDRARVVLVLD